MRVSATTTDPTGAQAQVQAQTSADNTSAATATSKSDIASKIGASQTPPPPPPMFSSPVTAFDAVTGSTVLEYKNTKTGDEEYQSPARAVLQYQQSLRAAENKPKGTTHA